MSYTVSRLARARQSENQAGLTVLELMTVLAVVGALTALSASNFQEFRNLAYLSAMKETIASQKIALNAGRISMDDDKTASGYYAAWSVTAGPVKGWRANFTPGLTNQKHMYQYVWYDEDCARGLSGKTCLLEGGDVRHCGSDRYQWWYRTRDGREYQYEFNASWPC